MAIDECDRLPSGQAVSGTGVREPGGLVARGPVAGRTRRRSRGASEVVDGFANLQASSLDSVWITGPIGPVGTHGARDLHGEIALSKFLQDLRVVVVVYTVTQPLQPHGCHHAFDADLL